MALTPAERKKISRERRKALSTDVTYPLRLHSVAPPDFGAMAVADDFGAMPIDDPIDRKALIDLIETLFLEGLIRTMARRRLLDAIGA
jgi:hypothetical protein